MGSGIRPTTSCARRWRRVVTGGAPVVLGLAALDARGEVLFTQNFEGLALQPFVSPTESGGSGADWTDVLPPGWSRDNTTTPAGSPAEFFGFTFMNKVSWIATESNQDRNLFTRGTGTVMVADPDAYDDGTNVEPDLFNVLVQTPTVPLTNVAAGTARLTFDSSFRPYSAMTASVEVSFDGGTSFTSLLSMNAANVPGGDSSLERVNEAVSLPLNNPAGAAGVIVRFGMRNADNDWWWAVDNITIDDQVPEPSALGLLGAAGFVAMRRRRRQE